MPRNPSSEGMTAGWDLLPMPVFPVITILGGMVEALGIVLIVQGAGGLINRLAESGSKGWWLQLHVLPDGMHLPASVVMAVAGVLLVLQSVAAGRGSAR